MLVRLLALLSLLLPRLSEASTSFTYNEDIQCGYPFEEFQITSVSCTDSGEYYAYVEGEEEGRIDECYLGESMELYGQVELLEAVYRYMKVGIKLCIKSEGYDEEGNDNRNNNWMSGWWHRDTCVQYHTKVDMMTATDEGYGYGSYYKKNYYQNQEEKQQEYETNYLEAGEHEWRARVHIPSDDFSIPSGYIMSAEITFYPKKSYQGLDYNDRANYEYPWYSKKKTYCTASFTAPQYEYGGYAAAGAAVACLGVFFSLYARKRRSVGVEVSSTQEQVAGESVSTGFESMASGIQA